MLKFNWLKFLILILLAHAGLLYILIFGSISQVLAMFLLFVLECLFSSTVIYHRLLSHRSWNAPRWIEIAGTFIGIFTFTGTPITRTLSHRYHHKYTDTEKDPHSPKILGVFLTYFPMLQKDKHMDLRLVDDLLKDDFHRWCHRNYFFIIGFSLGVSLLLLGPVWTIALLIAPGALCWNNISICNILCHLGKRETIINSRIVSIITFGEGWHKHHHENPDDPNFGVEKFDLGYWLIKRLEKPNLN